MRKSLLLGNLRYYHAVTLVLCVCALAACTSPGSNPTQGTNSSQIVATPTVDIGQARQVFEAGGELTYEEVLALRYDIVGDPDDLRKIEDSDAFYAAQVEFGKREDAFLTKLEKCRLKESVGWVSGWGNEIDINNREIPGRMKLSLEAYNPYSSSIKPDEVLKNGDVHIIQIIGVDEKEVVGMKYGQRIRFSGDLTLGNWGIAVRNAKYELLEDDMAISAPTEDELRDLRIVLERSMCNGSCPDYTLTITGDGKVTFDGRYYTKVVGNASTTISQEKIIELIKEFRKADFFNLSEDYAPPAFDAPTYKLSIQSGDKTKTVFNRDIPAPLRILESRIDQIVNSDQWIR